MKECPKCKCPYFTGTGFKTLDMPHAWQDKDGKWYCGPAEENMTYRCNHCGWSYSEHYSRGKNRGDTR